MATLPSERIWGHNWREDLPDGMRREGEEARDFLRLMQERDPGWLFVTMEDRHFSGEDTIRDRALRCVSYAELFGQQGCGGMPFGLVLKALVQLAELVIGVPAGPICGGRTNAPVGRAVHRAP